MLPVVSTAPSPPTDLAALREEVAAYPLWYHTMELGPGIVTRGWFDLRPIVERMPWPDVRGKRCLDIGTYDGFLAFELERRGARRGAGHRHLRPCELGLAPGDARLRP